ncbi:MAG: SMI1/KNR4 family protein [Terriglobia bacterium]
MEIIEPIPQNSSISMHEIEKFETHLGTKLPKEYSDFLLFYNGGRPRPSGFRFLEENAETESRIQFFYGINSHRSYSILRKMDIFMDRVPTGTIPIACDGVGNQILLSIRTADYGTILFWDHEKEPTEDGDGSTCTSLVARSFAEFTKLLTEL